MITDDTATTVINLLQVGQFQNGKRSWNIEVTHNGTKIHPEPYIHLQDPLTAQQYGKTFKFLVDDASDMHDTSQEKRRENDVLQGDARKRIADYCADILRPLQLDNQEHGSQKHNILIVEDNDVNNDDDRSLHNIVWELLENPEYWRQSSPSQVYVTRIMCSSGCKLSLPLNRDLQNDKPLRILLVIGRDLKLEPKSTKSQWKYRERVAPSLVQRSIMQVMEHLKEIGHPREVQLEILRPATFAELISYLGLNATDSNSTVNSREDFDIIHLDMHGEMRAPLQEPRGQERPHLLFTQIPLGPQPYILTTELAEILRQRTKLLVMNACNSSSPTGELGIRMVRTFLVQDMTCVSAASYRLQESTAKIYYPRFYMSLLLHGNFNKAAAEARLALRINKKRWNGEERDDYYVLWNWSTNMNPCLDLEETSRSIWLHLRVFLEVIPRLIFWVLACVLFIGHDWQQIHADWFPMYPVHRNFDKIEHHVSCAQRERRTSIPGITLYALEIEYHLKNNDKHSIYLHPPSFTSDFGLRRIRDLVWDMMRIWAETNFVIEVRYLQVKELLKNKSKSWFRPRFGIGTREEDLANVSDWYWRQHKKVQGQNQSVVKSLLIIDGFECLLPLAGDDGSKVGALDTITAIAQGMEVASEDLYVITIGSLQREEWENIPEEFARPTLGSRWARANVMMIPRHD